VVEPDSTVWDPGIDPAGVCVEQTGMITSSVLPIAAGLRESRRAERH